MLFPAISCPHIAIADNNYCTFVTVLCRYLQAHKKKENIQLIETLKIGIIILSNKDYFSTDIKLIICCSYFDFLNHVRTCLLFTSFIF